MDEPRDSPIIFDVDGRLRSRRYGDVYHTRDGGLGQAREVFLAGCGMPGRWLERRSFVVGELGFGTGLNICALLELWRERRPPGAHLHIFSVEAEPLSSADARRALSAFPEVAQVSELLLSRWPGRSSGFHRVDLPELGATLDVAVGEVSEALSAWSGRADAWFLDGFSPAANPEMWSRPVLRLVAERSAPGAALATWSVAGEVRRGLADAGFSVARRPGFGGKRERLEARAPGARASEGPLPRVAVVGAGIAGAALARAFRLLGVEPLLLDASKPGAGASGNPAALATPRLDASLGLAAQLHAQAFRHAVALYARLPDGVVSVGAFQLEASVRDGERFATIAASDLFEPGAVRKIGAEAASRRLHEAAPSALEFTQALVIEPARVLDAWAQGVRIAKVASLQRRDSAWRLLGAGGELVAEAEVVCLAAGAQLAALWPDAPILPVRGQLSWSDAACPMAVAWGAYAAPAPGGMVFGATYDRGDTDVDWRPEDDRRNLAALGERFPALAARAALSPLAGRAATRATTADHLPLAGEIESGLFVLGGLGARGFTLAPLLAEHLAAGALGAPSPLPAPLALIVRPARFAERAARRAPVARKP